MLIKYSPSQNAFYCPDLHQVMPDDALEVDAKTHALLFMAHQRGATIRASPSGMPEAVAERGAGAVIDLSTVTEKSDFQPKQPIKVRATVALAAARQHVTHAYLIKNRPTPEAWVAYLDALEPIADGTDTASTELPPPCRRYDPGVKP